ncbi:hypothetical protein H0H93_007482 [Arthromyces matolae]|nr:hypothetical protein H0H93_007482 [Arthromyces matolae]
MTVSRRIVVDDSDQLLNYTGGWIQQQPGSYDHYGNFGPTYLSTTHSTTSGGVVTFPFGGTSIQVFGTTCVSGIPTWDCYVDGVKFNSQNPFTSPENNWSLCELDSIIDGQHELTINVTSTNATFAFDYLVYTPSPTAALEPAIVRIDHTDPGLNYSSTGWSDLGGNAATSVAGSQVYFNFIGKGLSWVGYVPIEFGKASANGTYSVDGGSPTSFQLSGIDSSAPNSLYYQTFFTTQDLAQGPHTIVVTYNGNNGISGQIPLTLDFLLVTNATSAPSATSASPVSSTSTPAALNSSAKAATVLPVGAIVGIVVGVVLLITAMIVLFLLYTRRIRRLNSKPRAYDLTEPEISGFDPFQHPASPYTEPFIPESPPMADMAAMSVSSVHHVLASDAASSSAAFMSEDSKSFRTRQHGTSTVSVHVHRDSGLRLHNVDFGEGDVVENLPPLYTAT